METFTRLNPLLRSLASVAPANLPLRKTLACWWDLYLRRRGVNVSVRLHGQRLWLSAKWRSLDAFYERQALGSFIEALQPGDRVWDIGSHIGLYALLAAKRVGPNGRITAWEPSPESFRELNHHLAINGETLQCRTINELIADRAQDGIDFAIDSGAADSTTNQILTNAQRGAQAESVKLRSNTLDHWVEELAHVPDVLKMDIEGAEWFAFAGAQRLFSGGFGGRQPKILLSVHPASIWQYGGDVAALDRRVRELGYRRLSLTGAPAVIDDFAEYWLIPEPEGDAFAKRLRERSKRL